MNLEHWLWLAVAAYAVHVLEEFTLNWRDWARAVIGLPVEWTDFYLVNAIVIILGIVAANLASAAPGVALAYPALMLINAVFFHILPVIWTRGRYSPGAATAVVLFLPVGLLAYRAAHAENLLGARELVGSVCLGAALMSTPIVLLRIRDKPYFRQV